MKISKHLCLWGTGISLLTIVSAYALASVNDDLSFSTPVFSLDTQYSDQYKAFALAQFANTISPYDAAAFNLGFGEEQFQIGLTWAHAFTNNQRLKLGIEHFAQDNTYQFVSGPDHEFNGQNSVGAIYQYLLSSPHWYDFEVSGYFAKANNSDFSDQPFIVDGQQVTDVRNVVGGSIGGFGAGPTIILWTGSKLGLTVNYDNIHYSPSYEAATNKDGVGGTVSFSQQLTSKLSIGLLGSYRQPYQLYSGDISWRIRQTPDSTLNLELYASHLQSDVLLFNHENVLGLGLQYRWGRNSTSIDGTTAGDLLDWAQASPASLPSVFVMRDEAIRP